MKRLNMQEDVINFVQANRVQVIPITSDKYTLAMKAAHADGHISLGVTDVVIKGQEIIGHISLAGVPMVLVWMDSKKASSRDSLYVMNFLENLISRNPQAKHLVLPCASNSPFLPYLEKMGYKKQPQPFILFTKDL